MPFIENSQEGIQGIDEAELPVLLPENVANYRPSGVSPLAQVSDFLNTHSKAGIPSIRECDTLDTFVDSSFYYLRYLNPHNSEEFISTEALDKWGDVGLYLGGKEHITAHLIYARFIHKFLHNI
jgi:leucyl-tRNA synthetase